MDFLSRWLRRFRLSHEKWREEIGKHADELPFICPENSVPLFDGHRGMGSHQTGISRILCKGETKDDRDTATTAATGAACAAGFWFLTKFFRRLVEGDLPSTDEMPANSPENL